jgi:intracellular sulfur oxidation DsrE/DsrF family protein
MAMRSTLLLLLLLLGGAACAEGRYVETPYTAQKAVFEFYLDHPEKMGPALYWLRAFMNPLTSPPYSYQPEELHVVVVLHGNELVTVVKRHEERYEQVVERMRYYAQLGVRFKVCGLAAQDFGYAAEDFHDFIEVVPSAFNELAHWQHQGYALIIPRVLEKTFDMESIR